MVSISKFTVPALHWQLPWAALGVLLSVHPLAATGSEDDRHNSARQSVATTGDPTTVQLPTYIANVDPNDPLAFPIQSPAVISRFPPTLLAAGSRDFAVSSLTIMHRRLRAAGVPAELFIFDGLWHAFFVDPTLPESKELYSVIVTFFDRHLGRLSKQGST